MSRAFVSYLSVLTLSLFGLGTACSPGGGGGGLGDDDDDASTGATGAGGRGAGGSGNVTGGSGGTIMVAGGGPVDACANAGLPPEDCMPQPVPGCGDAEVNTAMEVCDDGNTRPGDCCSGACQVEPNCECDAAGCRSTIICGDGMRGPGEACDDGNAMSGDGCADDCHLVEIGYRCHTPGVPCERHYICGDGSHDANEGCDDGNITAGDGCSDHCRMEIGFKCEGSPSSCSATTCGDDKQEGAESCDDGNTLAFDGCSPDCRAEPLCETGEACTSSCGDGIVFGDEVCDDGNLRSGDGCSADCTEEEGYKCEVNNTCTRRPGVDPTTGEMGEVCAIEVPAIYRDFNGYANPGGHPNFAPGDLSDGATQGLVMPLLDAEGKPRLSGMNTMQAFLTNNAAFEQWYRNDPPASKPIPSSIVLWDKGGVAGDGSAGYVNRWGALGEQWYAKLEAAAYAPVTYGGPAGGGCQACVPSATGACYDPCVPWNDDESSCCGEIPAGLDGNPLFFPVDNAPGILMETREEAKVPEQYGWVGWPWEDEVAATLGVRMPIMTSTSPFPTALHNFSFTTEVKYWFKYDPAANAVLDFTGDDDVWVFLNGHLAIDLGSWHVPLNGRLTIGENITATANLDVLVPPTVTNRNGTAASFGMEPGNVYQIAVFHAERRKEGSSFKLTLSGFNLNPSECLTDCGDSMMGPGEECDDGSNRGGYNECAPGCILGPRCGDAVVQDEFEVCDDGVNAGEYGGCGPDCQPGPGCGDGVVTAPFEECDDGMNLGNYGGCAPLCVIGPYCGDGLIAISTNPETNMPYEACDDGNDTDGDGCSNCQFDIVIDR